MSLDVVIGLVGVIVTVLVVAGMILITPAALIPPISRRSRPTAPTS
jgi:hypothetical protein